MLSTKLSSSLVKSPVKLILPKTLRFLLLFVVVPISTFAPKLTSSTNLIENLLSKLLKLISSTIKILLWIFSILVLTLILGILLTNSIFIKSPWFNSLIEEDIPGRPLGPREPSGPL